MTTVTPQDRRTKKRDWDDFFRFGQLMLGQQWVFAKTMPEPYATGGIRIPNLLIRS
jgi:hypothetical protein